MALWNKVISGFDTEEETVNFGARTVAENNGSLYETATVATIESNGKVINTPKVSASVEHSRVCIAIDKAITIFENETCEKILLNAVFGSFITSHCISDNGLFVFVVLSTGTLYCLHSSMMGKVVFSRNITQSSDPILKTFVQKEDNDDLKLILVAKSGIIHSIVKFQTVKIQLALDNEDEAAAKVALDAIEYSQLFKGFPCDEVIHAAIACTEDEISVAMVLSDSFFMWPNEQYNDFKHSSYKYTKVEFLRNYNAMLCLCADHTLNLVCTSTLLGLRVYNHFVIDFTLITNNNDSCQILLVAKSENDFSHVLRVVTFPEWEQKYQINISPTTYLVEIKNFYDGDVLYVEGVSDSKGNNGQIDTIRVKTVLESIPEYQLQRILRRGQFEEAVAFAKKFNLSLEPVYYAKAVLFMSQLGPWVKKDSEPVDLNALIEILDEIENVQYVAECCNKALVPEYKQMRQLYLYARSRIMQNVEKLKKDDYLNLLCPINDTLHKLDTFHMIWGSQGNVIYYDKKTIKEWIRFSQGNCMDEYKMHLNLGELEAATIIWSRHLSGMVKGISAEVVQEIFATLPEGICPSRLWPWLSHFIPSILSMVPDAIYEIIFWGYRKTKSLEQSHRTSWPQIGIDFANKFIKLFRTEDNVQYSCFLQNYSNRNSALKQFVQLMQALSDIQKLKTDYRLGIPLEVYIGEPIEVSHVLLDRIHVDAIPDFVQKFLTQYLLNNSLRNDDVLSSYIQRIIRNSKSWWLDEEAPWQKRAVTVISLIQNLENKLEQTLDILRKAPVPWSSIFEQLAETSSNFDHALSIKIRTERNYVPMKLILKKYGYECIGVNDKLISRIIREDDDDMISNIMCLTKGNRSAQQKAVSSCLNYNINKGNFKKVMEILNNLDDEAVLYCCVRIVNCVTACLTLKGEALCVSHYIEMLGWIKYRLQEIIRTCKSQAHHCVNIIATIDEARSLYLLKQEFNITLTSKEYQTQKEEKLFYFVTKLYNDTENSGNLHTIYSKAFRMADLLKVQRLYAVFVLIQCVKSADVWKHFTRSDTKYLSFTAEECHYVNTICLALIEHVQIDAYVADTIKSLSSTALCMCSDEQLHDILLPYIWGSIYHNLFRNNNSTSLESKQELLRKTTWKLYPIYKDLATTPDQLLLALFKDVVVMQMHKTHAEPVAGELFANDNTKQHYNQVFLNNTLHKLKNIKADHNDYNLLQIAKTLYFCICAMANVNSAALIECRLIFSHHLMTLLRKLVSARTFDFQLSLSCLFMLPEEDACKWISAACKSFQIDYNRHLLVSMLGYEYFQLTENHKRAQSFQSKKVLHSWAQKLANYSISYKEILTSDASSKRDILQRIMNCNSDDLIPLLEDFCNTFGFNVQDCLLLYLQTLIKNWNPKLNITNSGGRKELNISEDEVNELRKRCDWIIAKISDKAVVKAWVTMIKPQINFYYYELFIILMDIIEEKNAEHRSYFYFLQNYTRDGQPTQIELDEWIHLNPSHTSLPAIAEWRLPFLPKIELLKLITPELNLKTYEKWLTIAPILKLQPHFICVLAIKGEVTRVWGNIRGKPSKEDSWTVSAKNNTLLSDIKKCIECIAGSDALYYGTAALYYVVNHTPPGADQVAAAQECYSYAQLAAQKAIDLKDGMLEKIKFKYLRFTSEHILRTYGLGQEKYLELIVNPHKLVCELYMDESIPQRYRSVTDHRPDINSAVEALNELFSINSIKLRLELLQEWLQPDTRYMKMYQSISDTFSLPEITDQNSNSDDNLLRACYMLEHGDSELSANFLINIGFGDSDEGYCPQVRYRALQVLQTIVDTATLENLTKRKLSTIRQYMQSLKYVHQLESLGLGYSIDTFESCSKHELVQIIWKTQHCSPGALSLITQICIDFEIYDYSLWDKCLTHLAELFMVTELKKIVVQVRNFSHIVNCNGYLSSWQVIVLEPFRRMDINPTTEQVNHCIEVLRLLHSCPVIHLLSFTEIVNYCLSCHQPHFAAAFLPFLGDTDKTHVLETIKTLKVPEILANLKALSDNGVLLVSYCYKLVEEASNIKLN